MSNIPLDRHVPLLVADLKQRANEVHDRGMHQAAATMRSAADTLTQMLTLHKMLVEREEKLTEEVVRLRP